MIIILDDVGIDLKLNEVLSRFGSTTETPPGNRNILLQSGYSQQQNVTKYHITVKEFVKTEMIFQNGLKTSQIDFVVRDGRHIKLHDLHLIRRFPFNVLIGAKKKGS
jgi:hypothetical protein